MNIYLLTQSESTGYDTYDSMVVCAESEETARAIHPCETYESKRPRPYWWENGRGEWASHPANVSVTYLGVAEPGSTEGIVCASFNAG